MLDYLVFTVIGVLGVILGIYVTKVWVERKCREVSFDLR